MALSTPSVVLGILVEQGKELPGLLRLAKKGPVEADSDTPGKVQNIVTRVLNSLKNAPEDAFFPEESVEKLVKKIEGTLDEFIKHDPGYKSRYEDLIKKVGDFEYRKSVSVVDSDPFNPDSLHDNNHLEEPDIDLSRVKELNDDEYRCLCCFILFPAGTNIKKREIIHCWIAMNCEDLSTNERLLAKFVDLGLIERLLLNQKSIGIYKMSVKVHSYLSHPQKNMTPSNEGEASWSILCKQMSISSSETQPDQRSFLKRMITTKPSIKIAKLKRKLSLNFNSTKEYHPTIIHFVTRENDALLKINSINVDGNQTIQPVGKEDLEGLSNIDSIETHSSAIDKPISKQDLDALPKMRLKVREKHFPTEALLNINQTTLDAERFKTMSKMKSMKVLHLGSWQQDCKKYIVVEDIEGFKYLKNLSEVRFLSLEGVSGIVKLPRSIYKIKTLKVLDLRGCNNLEQLPAGIKLLTELTHLDLSGCHLLDHVPFGITYLIKLQVLKGFVINTDQIEQFKPTQTGKNTHSSSPCRFADLSILKQLTKLTIVTRRFDFPKQHDFLTFCEMKELGCLRITWVGDSTDEGPIPIEDDVSIAFPFTLTKLELQAAPDHIASWVLHLISRDMGNYGLKKLYIRGGGLRELKYSFPRLHVVRLRYLPELRIDWDNFKKLFPNLDRLEVRQCPNLILFPCDNNGVWTKTGL